MTLVTFRLSASQDLSYDKNLEAITFVSDSVRWCQLMSDTVHCHCHCSITFASSLSGQYYMLYVWHVWSFWPVKCLFCLPV